jgi:predicted patatin/cPLA2 family phospholipase
MKWILLDDCNFHSIERGWFVLKKGSVYNAVHAQHYDPEIQRAVINRRKSHRSNQIVILEAEGKQRIFEIGEAVAPHSDSFRTFRRIKRCKRKATQ